MDSLPFLLAMGGLAVAAAALAWLGLAKVPPPQRLGPGDRDGWAALAARRGLDADLDGPPSTWTLHGEADGLPLRARIVEVEGGRWTEVRVRVPGLPEDLSARSRARRERVAHAIAVGHPDLDAALLCSGEPEALRAVAADPTRRAAWLDLLGPADGPVLVEGWLVRSVEGCEGAAVAALLDALLQGARELGA